MKTPKLPTIEMLKCDSCSQLHPIDECEIIVVKIIKGKNCSANIGGSSPVVAKKEVSAEPEEDKGTPLYEVKPGVVLPKKPVVPAMFAGVFTGPDSPDFESKGAKERRVV